jgi:hypothetical protein
MAAHESEVVRQLIGAWSLVSWKAIAPDGTISHPYGEHPKGQIIYQSEGRMTACLMRRQRARFASNNRLDATPVEREAAYRDYLSYFGSFTVQETDGTVTHHVEGATFPNWSGTDLVRKYCFADGTLTLSLVRADGTVHELLWQRHL